MNMSTAIIVAMALFLTPFMGQGVALAILWAGACVGVGVARIPTERAIYNIKIHDDEGEGRDG